MEWQPNIYDPGSIPHAQSTRIHSRPYSANHGQRPMHQVSQLPIDSTTCFSKFWKTT
jgi:hypothetical protein